MTPTDTVKTTLTEARKPFYASLGVTELAVAKVKELPTVTKTEAGRLQAQVKALPETVATQVTTLSGKAKILYAGLAERGEKVFADLRKQQPAATAVAAGKSAVQQARSATVRPRRTAKPAAATSAAQGS